MNNVEMNKEQRHNPVARPWLRPILICMAAVGIACLAITGGMIWHLMGSIDFEPEAAEASTPEVAAAVTVPKGAKETIEANMRAFLLAETNEDRLKYVYQPEDEKSSMDRYYGQQGHREIPLWKTQRIEKTNSTEGEIWFVVYRDLNNKQRLVSFQKLGDHYLLHWSAMTAYCEMPWGEFIVQRPSRPVMMRCYLRQYEGAWPVGISPEQYHCFLIEDRDGLFSELAIMARDSVGYTTLVDLPKASAHPVTLNLLYDQMSDVTGSAARILKIESLKHLRWQKMAMDRRLQGLEFESPNQ